MEGQVKNPHRFSRKMLLRLMGEVSSGDELSPEKSAILAVREIVKEVEERREVPFRKVG